MLLIYISHSSGHTKRYNSKASKLEYIINIFIYPTSTIVTVSFNFRRSDTRCPLCSKQAARYCPSDGSCHVSIIAQNACMSREIRSVFQRQICLQYFKGRTRNTDL
jgi:hypothetical protein